MSARTGGWDSATGGSPSSTCRTACSPCSARTGSAWSSTGRSTTIRHCAANSKAGAPASAPTATPR
ncbi:hypothetical protein AAW14_11560 [Streptomyces hygroscopicus]|nr:hypothetical protein [Streptomyces hygroscopicus]